MLSATDKQPYAMSLESAALDLLKRYWGYDAFRPLQAEIIDTVASGGDAFVLMPTGGGKSLCYQIPALMRDGLTIVVSPLIALMKDQVEQLRRRGVKAACLVSSMNASEVETVINNGIYGDLKLLYVSPERLRQHTFRSQMRMMNIALFAIDEAHCISQWGYDFRPSYLELTTLRDDFPQVPIIALTASATPAVVDDIRRLLKLRKNSKIFRSSFVRSNLRYMAFEEADKTGRLLRIIERVGGSGIVYVRSRRRSHEIAMMLQGRGVSAEYYHAGRKVQERDLCQRLWSENKIRVMVATNAFGMGIDKPDVRFVVHLDPPDSPEAYYQEAGRAGRDGRPSYCVVLYDRGDLTRLEEYALRKVPSTKVLRGVYNALCNYYKLPVGSGEGVRFPLDMEKLCRAFGMDPTDCYSAMQYLEREGLIALPPDDAMQSRLHATADHDDIYRYRLSHQQYEPLLNVIFRLYGGLFSDYVVIDEREIARRCYMHEQEVVKMLKHLASLHFFDYEPRMGGQTICFTASRVDAQWLFFNETLYRQMRENALERCRAMIDYLAVGDDCRSQKLCRYFGEEDVAPCGGCDRCIMKRKTQRHDGELQNMIVALLESTPLTAQEIVSRIGDDTLSVDDIERVLRDMVDRRKVGIDSEFRFYV